MKMQECRKANWPGRRRANTPRDVHWYAERACMGWCEHAWTCVRRCSLDVGLREILLELWLVGKYFIRLSNNSVIDPDVRKVDHGGCA
ncbi:hypothetical protein CRG98_012102 [Punica granatum]|uniref:Uncharacterized protein n=1 Tax=Punica granatum TaxID=22663 RepID=A0A2I0KGA9_PUNGR|nr:hypothetical protein CRG98_012102 [Punica granatum]